MESVINLSREIQPIHWPDILTITRMAYANMSGVDKQFTNLTSSWLGQKIGYLWLPLYFLLAGHGYKVVIAGEIVACAYLNFHHLSSFVFNVNVNQSFRQKGIGSYLMQYLATETHKQGRFWMALQVDADNHPARSFYKKLGYQSYNPYYLGCQYPPALPTITDTRVHITPLRYNRHTIARHYTTIEQEQGDHWATPVISRDYQAKVAHDGSHWRCLVGEETIGYAWLGGQQNILIQLALEPAWWGHEITLPLLNLLRQKWSGVPTALYIYPASSQHLTALTPLLTPYSFSQHTKSTLLMLKHLPQSP